MQPSAVAKPSGPLPVGQDPSEKGRHRASLGAALAPGISFLVALSLALWLHFSGQEPHNVFFSDSRHYLESCQQLVTLIQSMTAGLSAGSGFHPQISRSLADNVMLDGPLMPLLPAIYFALTGKSPTPLDWQPFVVLACTVHALSAGLVCALAGQLTGSRKWALLAGLSWATYPSALVASGRYLTETPATLLLLWTLWSAARLIEPAGKNNLAVAGNAFRLGVLTGATLLFKPVLVPCSLATTALALCFTKRWKTKAVMSVLIAAGLATLLVPWTLSSKALTGRIYLTPQRVPVFNVAKGCDVEADGWGSLPNFPLTDLLCTTDAVLPTIAAVLQTHPAELVGLTLRKITRLWGIPWNDFRLPVLGLDNQSQQWWHLTLLALSAAGALGVFSARAVSGDSEASARRACFVGSAAILTVAAHLVYVPFETISRYGFSSMPFVLILAVYGLFVAARLPARRRPLAVIVTCSLALFALDKCAGIESFVAMLADFRAALIAKLACEWLLIAAATVCALKYAKQFSDSRAAANLSVALNCVVAIGAFAVSLAFCLDGKESREWSSTVQSGSTIVRTIDLAKTALPPGEQSDFAAVLIDGDTSLINARVEVNGHSIDAQPELLLRFKPSQYFLFDIMRTFAAKVGTSVENVRQWRALTFPSAWLNRHGTNQIRLSAKAGTSVTIYGDYLDDWNRRLHLPVDDFFSAARFCNATEGTEGRLYDPVITPLVASRCWLERNGQADYYDLSSYRGKQTGQYRLFLSVGVGPESVSGTKANLACLPALSARFERKLVARDFDPLIAHTLTEDADLRINRAILKSVSDLGCRIRLPEAMRSPDFLRITISGSIRAGAQPAIGSILPIVQGGGSSPPTFKLFATPPYLVAGKEWTKFEISDVVPNCEIKGGVREISLALFPGAWEEVWEYGCDRRCGDVCFKNLRLEVAPVTQPRLDNRKQLLY